MHVREPAESVTVAVTEWEEGDVGKVPVTWLFAGAAKVEPVAVYATDDTVPEPPVTVATGKLTEAVDGLHWYCSLWVAGQVITNGCVTVEKIKIKRMMIIIKAGECNENDRNKTKQNKTKQKN